MPRLSRKLLSRAYNISPLLPALLRTCRTLPSARNELRWLREHVDTNFPSMKYGEDQNYSLLAHLCRQRSRGVPLQYLLGSQPFGELDIICRPGVLIPRYISPKYSKTRSLTSLGQRLRHTLLILLTLSRVTQHSKALPQ